MLGGCVGDGKLVRSRSTTGTAGILGDVLQHFILGEREGFGTAGIRVSQDLLSILKKPPFPGQFVDKYRNFIKWGALSDNLTIVNTFLSRELICKLETHGPILALRLFLNLMQSRL